MPEQQTSPINWLKREYQSLFFYLFITEESKVLIWTIFMQSGIEFGWNFREYLCYLAFGVVLSGCMTNILLIRQAECNIKCNIKSWLHRDGKLMSWELLHSWTFFFYFPWQKKRGELLLSWCSQTEQGSGVKWWANEKGSKRRCCFQQGAAGQAQLQQGLQTLWT